MTIIKNVPKSLANNRLDKVAASLFPDFSRTQIKRWILDGRILINGDLSKPKDMTQENDEIEIIDYKTGKAKERLDKIISKNKIKCKGEKYDRYKRLIAICYKKKNRFK